jgi:hypothetical protein
LEKTIKDISAIQLQQIASKELKKNLSLKRELIQHHVELRIKGMQQLAEIRMRDKDEAGAEAIRQISKAKANQRDCKTIKHLFKPQFHSGINSIEIPHLNQHNEETDNPDEAISWKRVTDPSQVEENLLCRNITHFGQAQGTLFTKSPLQEHFQYKGASKAVNLLLNGEINFSKHLNGTTGAKTLLQHLGNKNTLPNMNCKIELPTFASMLRKWAESKSTSPSGRHLGHYKCLLADDNHQMHYDETNPDPKDKIMQVYHKIATTTLRIGSSLDK